MAVSAFARLAAEVGIKSASVDHYVPSKASMAAAVPRRYGNRFFVGVE
jgi:TetR/AcrR family transcriptional repressor of nem operon